MEVADYAAELDENRGRMLTVLFDSDHGELGSNEIRDRAGVKSGSKHKFLSDLQEMGLIEKRGSRDTSSPGAIEEYIYGITDTGRAVAREFVDRRPAEVSERVQLLEQQVDELLEQVEDNGSRLDNLEDGIGEMKPRVDAHGDALEYLRENTDLFPPRM